MNKSKIKFNIVSIATLIIIFMFVGGVWAEEKTNIKKNFLIQNPISGVLCFVTEDGIVLDKTESGMNMADVYHGGRQEGININEKYYFSEQKKEYIINDKKDNDLNKVNENIEKFPSVIDSYRDNDGKYVLDRIKTDDFYVKKDENDKFTFVSTKYNYTLTNISEFRDYNNVVDQRAYLLIKDDDGYLIDEDGRLVFMSSKKDLAYRYSEKKVVLINKKFIFINEYAGYGTYMMIKRGKKANEDKARYNGYSEYVYYGERQKEEDIRSYVDDYISTDHIKVVNLDGKYYVKLWDDHFGRKNTYCLIAEDGSIARNAIVKEDLIFLESNGKYKLYDINGNLVFDNLGSENLVQLGEVNFMYDEFNNYYLINKGKNFAVIDKYGNIILDNIEQGIVNTEKRTSEAYKEEGVKYNDKYFSAIINNEYCVFSKEMKIIGKNDNLFDLDVFSDGDYYLLHNDGKYKIYHKDGNEILSYENLPGREENNSKENLLKFTPSIFYDYRRYFINNSNFDWYNINAHQDDDIWAIASGQWIDVDRDFPDFQFEDINGDLAIFENGKYNLYDKNGNKLLDDFKLLARYNDDYILFVKGFNYGLIDRNGNIKFKLSIFDGMEDDE